MRSRCLVKIEGGGFGHIGAEALGKGGGIIGVNVGVLGRTRNGDVGKAGVEEFGERIGVHIDEDAVFGQTLGTVAGNGIAVIEVPHPSGVEIDSSSVIHFHGQAIVIADGFDPAAITVVHVEVLIIVRELDAITGRELMRKAGVNIDSAQTLRIVGHLPAICSGNGDSVVFAIGRDDGGVAVSFQAQLLAATNVLHGVAGGVPGGPCSICSAHVVSSHEHRERNILFSDSPAGILTFSLACCSRKTTQSPAEPLPATPA
jgi:hypothetical protein